MTRRDEFLGRHPDFHPGMLAYSDDGQELGEVWKLDEESLTVEKGEFFPTDRRLPYDTVDDIRDDHLILKRSRADLEEGTTGEYDRRQEPTRMKAGPMPGGETFRDEQAEARRDLRSTDYEDSGSTANEDTELDRERFRKRE